MDQFKKEQIIDEINGSKLLAEVAISARNDEIVSHVSNIIDSCNLKEHVIVKAASDAIAVKLPRVTMTMPPDDGHSYSICTYINFDCTDDGIFPTLEIGGLGYRTIACGSNSCMMLKAMSAVADKLDEIKNHVNSDTFKSYEADIKAYIDAEKSLNDFNKDEREEKIKLTASSFHADQLLKDSSGRTHLIKKATLKRLWLSDWHYYNGHPKQSEDKNIIAQWIVDGQWSICV